MNADETGFQKFSWLGWILMSIVGVHIVAGIGWLREKYDERAKRKTNQDVLEKIEQIHTGDPLEKVLQLFPNAYTNFSDGTGEFRIHVKGLSYHYGSTWQNYRFSVVSGKVTLLNVECGCKTIQSATHGLQYYFQRAWYSKADD